MTVNTLTGLPLYLSPSQLSVYKSFRSLPLFAILFASRLYSISSRVVRNLRPPSRVAAYQSLPYWTCLFLGSLVAAAAFLLLPNNAFIWSGGEALAGGRVVDRVICSCCLVLNEILDCFVNVLFPVNAEERFMVIFGVAIVVRDFWQHLEQYRTVCSIYSLEEIVIRP